MTRRDDDDAHERGSYERELEHAERIKAIAPSSLASRGAPDVTRVSRLVELMLAVARPDEDVYVIPPDLSVAFECEDTDRWTRRERGVEAWTDRVYPAMARISVAERELTLPQARSELVELLEKRTARDPAELERLEKHWTALAHARGVITS